jgi:hypothetical protein
VDEETMKKIPENYQKKLAEAAPSWEPICANNSESQTTPEIL